MGTCGFVGVVYDGELKGAYNHNDSYPSGLGLDVLRWARKSRRKTVKVPALIKNLVVVQEEDTPTPEQVARLMAYADFNVGSGSVESWYCLLRETQGDLGAILESGYVLDGTHAAVEGWAEWAYVVDWDRHVLEVYEGYQRDPHEEGRFAHMRAEEEEEPRTYPVRLTATFPFDSLPKDAKFVEELEGLTEDE